MFCERNSRELSSSGLQAQCLNFSACCPQLLKTQLSNSKQKNVVLLKDGRKSKEYNFPFLLILELFSLCHNSSHRKSHAPETERLTYWRFLDSPDLFISSSLIFFFFDSKLMNERKSMGLTLICLM